jgi:hypothetical protein
VSKESVWGRPIRIIAAAIVLANCGGDDGEGNQMVFDDLGGGSEVIMVYPGVSDAPPDTEYNGTFKDGDKVEAECWINGRIVRSHPELGEDERSSDIWVRFLGSTGTEHFATAVYIKSPEDLVSSIPEC